MSAAESTSPSSSPSAAASGASSTKAAASKQTPSSKMHRRSRSGCFTCRLRRKKCDETKPGCRACRHLGLSCEYKRPIWWTNAEQRRQQKERIKNIIKRTKLNEKSQHALPLTTSTPPSLCHRGMTLESFTRGGSIESQSSSSDYEFAHPCGFPGFYGTMPPLHAPFPQYPNPACQPFDAPFAIDFKTETHVFVNDVPTRRDSTISTFSAFHSPPAAGGMAGEGFFQQDSYFEHRQETFKEEPVDAGFLDFSNSAPFSPTRPAAASSPTLDSAMSPPAHPSMVAIEDCDQHLLNHFVDNIVQLVFPMLEVNHPGSTRTDIILPALESNQTYLSSCLSTAALHLKTARGVQSVQLDNDILRHKVATINQLCEALAQAKDYEKILEATLSLIFFQCSVGGPDDALSDVPDVPDAPDIPWHAHFQAATSLLRELQLPAQLVQGAQPTPFNMTVAAWIDILGATMLGRAPVFADTYREMNIAETSAGLASLMGCDDKIIFLISEIACLEALKHDGMDEVQLCTHIKLLGDHITLAEQSSPALDSAVSATGALFPAQLRTNISTVFRLAARIYLCSLVPGFDRAQDNIANLVDSLASALRYIPAGAAGFDRALAWPLLIAGAASLPSSPFRTLFAERTAQMGEAARLGSVGRAAELLKQVWAVNDEGLARGERPGVHWRDVMKANGWDFLLI